MIKINLLPPNIYEARVVRNLIVVFAVLLVVVIAVIGAIKFKTDKATAAMKAEADRVQELDRQAKEWMQKASDARAFIAPIQSKRQFFEDVWKHNEIYPGLYEELAKFTYAKVMYSALQTNGQQLTLTAYTPSLSDAGRYLLNLYRATHIFSSVQISGIPGYPMQGGQAGGGSMPSMPSMPGMMPPMPPPGGGGGTQLPRPVLGPGAYRAMMGGGMPGMGGLPPPGGLPGAEGLPAPSYSGEGAISSAMEKAEERRKGFTLAVVCTLRNAVNPPTVPGMTSAQAVPGAPGMPAPGGGLPAPQGTR